MTTARGAGCGKVILLGEHSVVHGRPALAAGLSRGATAEVSASTDGLTRARFVFDTAEVDVLASQDADHSLGRALAALLATYTEPPPMQLTVRLELPAGAGLGASAAMGVAVSVATAPVLICTRSLLPLCSRTRHSASSCLRLPRVRSHAPRPFP